jgi:hypothetical protein
MTQRKAAALAIRTSTKTHTSLAKLKHGSKLESVSQHDEVSLSDVCIVDVSAISACMSISLVLLANQCHDKSWMATHARLFPYGSLRDQSPTAVVAHSINDSCKRRLGSRYRRNAITLKNSIGFFRHRCRTLVMESLVYRHHASTFGYGKFLALTVLFGWQQLLSTHGIGWTILLRTRGVHASFAVWLDAVE